MLLLKYGCAHQLFYNSFNESRYKLVTINLEHNCAYQKLIYFQNITNGELKMVHLKTVTSMKHCCYLLCAQCKMFHNSKWKIYKRAAKNSDVLQGIRSFQSKGEGTIHFTVTSPKPSEESKEPTLVTTLVTSDPKEIKRQTERYCINIRYTKAMKMYSTFFPDW